MTASIESEAQQRDNVGRAAVVANAGGMRRDRSKRITPGRVLVMLALSACTVVFIYPFVWLISASFKTRAEVFDNRIIPKTFTLQNYVQVWEEAPMLLWLGNTLLVTVLAALTVTISSSLVAWGFSYFRWPGRNAVFGLVLATMMLPGAVTMIPTFLIWNALGLTGTLYPLWAGNLFGSAFYIFLLRQFFLGLPRDRRHPAVRVPGGLDGPHASAHLPARPGHLHDPARPQDARGPVRVRRGVPLGDHRDGRRDHHRADGDPVLPRPAPLRRGHRHDREQGLTGRVRVRPGAVVRHPPG
jgi:hypothetical protein